MSSDTCAFCGKAATMTKEHIWPQCIIRRVPRYNMRFSAQAQKVFGADLIVKDVCSTCNNGPLSALDDYACELFDSYFYRVIERGEAVEFGYEHGKLLRWLLKVSYNSSRTTKTDLAFYRPLRNYILGSAEKPPFVSVTLDIVVPSLINGITLEPKATRCARILLGKSRPWICVRLVAINSFYFYIVITAENTVSVSQRELAESRSILKGKFLSASGQLTLKDHQSDIYEMHIPHLRDNSKLYDEFIERYRKLH